MERPRFTLFGGSSLHCAPPQDGGGRPFDKTPKPGGPRKPPAAEPAAQEEGASDGEGGRKPTPEPAPEESSASPEAEAQPEPEEEQDEGEPTPGPFPPGDHRNDSLFALGFYSLWSEVVEGSGVVVPDSEARMKEQLKHLCRDDTLGMMLILSARWAPADRFSAPPDSACFSLNALAKDLDDGRVAATSNTLRNIILPAASACGLICGFEAEADKASTKSAMEKRAAQRHKIHISKKGFALMRKYFRALKQSKGE